MLNIPVFPIPNCVTFPGTTFPLHVFEPRYRNMIQYCLDNDSLLAIAHTQKVVQEAKPDQELVDALQSNQATYKPYPVFSAGKCELLKTLDDGRMVLNVHLEDRFIAVSEVQTLPFTICRCETFVDRPIEGQLLQDAEMLKEKILIRLQALTAGQPEINTILKSQEWAEKELIEFSFSIFGLLGLPPELKQEFLEMTSVTERLSSLLDLLNN